MAQIKSNFEQVRIPFQKMSFTPDIPPTVLAPNEYNLGFNIETDIRGIRSVLGDEEILFEIPDSQTPIYLTGGYRANNVWWFVLATSNGNWYAMNSAGVVNVTPGGVPLSGYSEDTNITDAWNGTTLFVNDGIHPPMYLVADSSEFVQYENDPLGPGYIWNYNPAWSSLTAGFQRLFNTPNVGSILIAGNLTSVDAISSIITNFPTTVRWSQAFGLNDGPTTWAPTLTNVANELEVPVRGPVVDGFPCNGNFFVCSYWDTVVFSPINFQSTSAPVLGIRPFNQGRGLLNANCWANADNIVYGVDARDIWVFDGNKFVGLGNQRVKNYFYSNLHPAYTDRVFLENNTQKNQIEIYYPSLASTDGWCDQMISYRYDLDCWNPPREVYHASQATEAPVYQEFPDSTVGFNQASRTMVYCSGVDDSTTNRLIQKDRGHTFLGNVAISSEFRRDNIHLVDKYSEQLMVHRILPEVNNLSQQGLVTTSTGNIQIDLGGSDSTGQQTTFKPVVNMSIDTCDPWTQIDQNVYRINSVRISNTSSTDTWICPAITWQFTRTQDSR
jgi:hypothetical protein